MELIIGIQVTVPARAGALNDLGHCLKGNGIPAGLNYVKPYQSAR